MTHLSLARRQGGGLCGLLFLLVQLYLAAHQAFVLHVRCAQDGEFTHGRMSMAPGEPGAGEELAAFAGSDEHGEHCAFLLGNPPQSSPNVGPCATVRPCTSQLVLSTCRASETSIEALFLLAPKQSPPQAG